jgi:hypothetical protein
MIKALFLSSFLLLIIMMMIRRGIRLAWSWLPIIYQASRRISTELMILMSSFFSFSLWRSTPRVRIISRLLANCFMINDVRSPTAITRDLFWSSSHINTLSRHRSSFTLYLIEALLSKLLISMLYSLHYRVFVSYHSFSKHWRWSIGVIRILSNKNLLMFFGINLSLVLSLLYPINEVTTIGCLIHSKSCWWAPTYCRICTWCSWAQLLWANYRITWACCQTKNWANLLLVRKLMLRLSCCSRKYLMKGIIAYRCCILRYCGKLCSWCRDQTLAVGLLMKD